MNEKTLVRIYPENQAEPEWSGTLQDFRDANAEDPSLEDWVDEMRREGRTWIGGGAIPLSMVTLRKVLS